MNVGEGNEIAVTALSSNAIFASTTVTSAVGQYSISGTLLNTNFITLSSPGGAGSLAVLGNNLFLEKRVLTPTSILADSLQSLAITFSR